MEFRDYIKRDLYRYGLKGFKGFIKALSIPGFVYIYFYRRGNLSKNKFLRYYYKIILKFYSFVFGFQIPVDTKIGHGLYLGHHGHVIINPAVVLGNNCALSPGVTIGLNPRGKSKGTPVIGNKVWIGPNAVIVGGVTIGDDVIIAPNSYVNGNIPSHSIVVGNPAKYVHRDNATDTYMDWIF
jgi:serine O-acetyltransferase